MTDEWVPGTFGKFWHQETSPGDDEQVTHQCPEGPGHLLTPCCGRTPFELPRIDRITLDSSLVNCKGAV